MASSTGLVDCMLCACMHWHQFRAATFECCCQSNHTHASPALSHTTPSTSQAWWQHLLRHGYRETASDWVSRRLHIGHVLLNIRQLCRPVPPVLLWQAQQMHAAPGSQVHPVVGVSAGACAAKDGASPHRAHVYNMHAGVDDCTASHAVVHSGHTYCCHAQQRDTAVKLRLEGIIMHIVSCWWRYPVATVLLACCCLLVAYAGVLACCVMLPSAACVFLASLKNAGYTFVRAGESDCAC